MLAFIIPFKPKENSKNWNLDCNYLNKTLRSILNQTTDNYQIFVITHDMPFDSIPNPKIDYILFPHKYRVFEEIEDRQEQMKRNSYLSERDVEYLFDQGRKQMYGAQLAKKRGFEFVMCVDADDIISKALASYVKQNKLSNQIGWFVNKGYYFIAEKGVYIRQPYAMNMVNGSCYIIHQSYIPGEDQFPTTLSAVNFFAEHPYLKTRIKEYFGKELQPLPFYAVIYVISSLNWNASIEKLKGNGLYHLLKYWTRRVIFKKQIHSNFYLKD